MYKTNKLIAVFKLYFSTCKLGHTDIRRQKHNNTAAMHTYAYNMYHMHHDVPISTKMYQYSEISNPGTYKYNPIHSQGTMIPNNRIL